MKFNAYFLVHAKRENYYYTERYADTSINFENIAFVTTFINEGNVLR